MNSDRFISKQCPFEPILLIRKHSFDDISLKSPTFSIRPSRSFDSGQSICLPQRFLPSLTDIDSRDERVFYKTPKSHEKPHSIDRIERQDFSKGKPLENIKKALLLAKNLTQEPKTKARRRASVQDRIESFEKMKNQQRSMNIQSLEDNPEENLEEKLNVKARIAEFERRSSIDSESGNLLSPKSLKTRIYPFETLISDPILENTKALDERFDEIRKVFGPKQSGERIIPIKLLANERSMENMIPIKFLDESSLEKRQRPILVESFIRSIEPSKCSAFVSGLGMKREPKSMEIQDFSSHYQISLDCSLWACEQIETITCLMAVNANRFHLYPRFPGVYLHLDIHEETKERPKLSSDQSIMNGNHSDEYLTPEEDLESIRAGEPRTQSIVVKGKREHETFAVANLEAPVRGRETVNKTIVVGVKQKSLLTEKVSADIKIPLQLRSNEKLSEEGSSKIEDLEEEGVTGETTQLVEQQLLEIGRLAENIANAVNKHSNQRNRESEVMSTSASSSFIRLDNIDEEMPRIQPGVHSLHKCASTPRVFSIDNAVEIQPNPVKRVFPTIGIEAGAMVDKLSKGLADLTSGSQDRLQKWKNKLQTTAKRYQKDSSEPPPIQRNCFPKFATKEESAKTNWAMSGSHSIPQPRALHSSKSLQNAGSIIHGTSLNTQLSLDMEHRTLKSRENSSSQKNLFSYEQYDNVYHGKPPGPARLPPISGVRPDGTDLVRPIAFRPVPPANDIIKRQSAGAFRTEFDRSRTSALSSSLNGGTPPIPTSAVPASKPKGIHQPSTSFSQFPHRRGSMENEYDTVNEFYEKNDAGSNGSDYSSGGAGSLGRKAPTQNGHIGSPGSTNKKSFTSSTSSSVSRHSSGVHVTPSPSDSGIVDYESIIRDKENELREVRNTMEQNEEIIIKVYQEKERNYKNELTSLRARLTASEKGENALRAQLSSCQRQTESMRMSVEGLMAEKRDLERRCAQLERDVAQLKGQQCAECRRGVYANGNHQQIQMPRIAKEVTPSEDLRDEVSQLRREVATLRDALGSVTMFNNNHTVSTQLNRTPSEPKIVSASRDRLI